MYAVIKTGGKQYRVAPQDIIQIEKVPGEIGETIKFAEVLMVGGEGDPQIGTPIVKGASVAGEVLEQGRGGKIIVFKKKRRKNYRRKNGHRQDLTTIRITDISTGGAKIAKPKSAQKEESVEAITPLFDRPEGEADDLTRISGVGPVLVEKLNALGITTFLQIAAFSDDDVANVNEVLNFKGRVEREDWVAQAEKLAAGESE